MKLEQFNETHKQEVIGLFTRVFSTAENESEGHLIGDLVSKLISTTATEDLYSFIALSDDRITAAIFFSRLIVPSGQDAFILSPVAVSTNEQGKGIGQLLINHGLNHLKALQVSLIFTYGDPAFYSKVGFCQIKESTVQPPFALSQPQGWLAQSLDDSEIETMKGKVTCSAALNDPKLW